LVGAGWTPVEAIHAGTLGAATAIGVEDSCGSIERGKAADLVVLRGDPSSRIAAVRQVECVYQHGRLVARGGQLTVDARPTPWDRPGA
jgi:imidazolonepropionase-like amidohydrolase